MNHTSSLSIALKEWDSVCRALAAGTQIILLRKGGILEAHGGFELENPRFLLFPTFLHQNLEMLKPAAREGFVPHAAEPQQIVLSAFGDVTDIVRLKHREQMDALDAEHIWTPPLVDMRFNYRPMNPLYLLMVRVFALPEPITIQNTPEYAGCKSWVPLQEPIAIDGARPVIDESTYQSRRDGMVKRLGA